MHYRFVALQHQARDSVLQKMRMGNGNNHHAIFRIALSGKNMGAGDEGAGKIPLEISLFAGGENDKNTDKLIFNHEACAPLAQKLLMILAGLPYRRELLSCRIDWGNSDNQAAQAALQFSKISAEACWICRLMLMAMPLIC